MNPLPSSWMKEMKSAFCCVVHLEVASGKKQDGVEVVQVPGVIFELLLGQDFGVGAERGFPCPALFPKALDGGHGVGDGFVAVSLFLADDEEMLLRGLSCAQLSYDQGEAEGFHGSSILQRPFAGGLFRALTRGGTGYHEVNP